jgi:SAM-dependent methyltransferase
VTAVDESEVYTLLHTGNPGDVEHYERVCAGAESVLELGSGAGRIALRLAARGHHVTGLELDRGLLERSRAAASDLPASDQERLELTSGDMRDFSLGRSFDRVLIPYNGLYCLGGLPGALRCFEAARAHLAPHGELWLDVYSADAFHAEAPEDDAEGAPDDDAPVAELTLDGQRVQAWERSTWRREEQCLDVHYELRDSRGEPVAASSLQHHYLLAAEVVLLLDEAGFEITNVCGGFGGEPFDDDSEFLVVGARALSDEELSLREREAREDDELEAEPEK